MSYKETMIAKYGSEELWKAHLREIAAKGGAKSSGYKFGHGKVDPSVAGAAGGKVSRREYPSIAGYKGGRVKRPKA